MYAIIQLNGGQLWIENNIVFKFEKINEFEGSFISLNKILLFQKKSSIYIGQPFLQPNILKILCIVMKKITLNKIQIYKMKAKKKYRKKKGYTHCFTYLFPIFY
uniref:50S ribosomal protein L21, chloroplastic n=1 Tax=Pteridomonas danica TaxID=38822 RepID=A0A7T1C523_9STRA|nr:ribosomal protein L21 [Pteridomonas danica]QPM99300.1 ribosomal protein L21 [Pteridomonas danica]